uniref:Uncharacterized protein n=1 Tax=Knipowitschia caucasica TaxID=637954 RepID=A0AAV2L6N9_KNICA
MAARRSIGGGGCVSPLRIGSAVYGLVFGLCASPPGLHTAVLHVCLTYMMGTADGIQSSFGGTTVNVCPLRLALCGAGCEPSPEFDERKLFVIFAVSHYPRVL